MFPALIRDPSVEAYKWEKEIKHHCELMTLKVGNHELFRTFFSWHFPSLSGDWDGDEEIGASRERIIEDIASDILGKLPRQYDIEKVKKAYQINITATGVVLIQELELFNTLICHIKDHLILLKQVTIHISLPRIL